ncbi:MAG: ATP-dependent Zn protease [Chloroflexaceae bacterium]|nr:ATP-dependent Zn protease [Chloroflexaceae bacterium]
MSQTALNLIAIAVFTITMSTLAGPLIHLSPAVPAAVTAGLLGLAAVDTLALESRGATLLVDAFASEQERERVLIHEAGHFLAAYCLGIPVIGYTLTAWEAWRAGQPGQGGVVFDTTYLQTLTPRQLPLVLERYATVWMAGIAAETLRGDRVTGGDGDRQRLREALKLAGLPPNTYAQKESWALLQAKNLLERQRQAYDALVTAMKERASIADCYRVIQEAMLRE